MISMKKTAIAAAMGLSMVAGAAQAAPVVNFNFTGAFVMFDGYDPTFSNPVNVVDNGNGIAGDPISGTMTMDYGTGAGSASIIPGALFFGSAWNAHNVVLQALNNTGLVQANMLFDWGAADTTTATDWSNPAAVDGDGTGTCGVHNCNIGVTVNFQMMPGANAGEYTFSTTYSSMPVGPFAGFQPTFNGTATVATPVPAAAWLLGSGLIGLVGVARRRKAA